MPSILRVTKFGLKNFWRNIWLSVATTVIMIVTLFIISVIVMLNMLASAAIDEVQNKVDLTVYFRNDAAEERILEVRTQVLNLNTVETTNYISKDEALEQFKKEHEGDEVILESLNVLGDNPLEPALVVKANETENYAEISAFLESDKFNDVISKVNFEDNRQLIEKLLNITDNIRKGGLVVGIIFVIIAVLVVFNTVRLAIYTHKEEIGIMKLVGATNWFVRGPFILEGVVYGLIGAFATLLLLYPILQAASPRVSSFFENQALDISQYYAENIIWIAGGLIALGVILGIISSAIAVGRYLRK
ncbi:cell division protein FtsX [Patescibacteria group bacterium]